MAGQIDAAVPRRKERAGGANIVGGQTDAGGHLDTGRLTLARCAVEAGRVACGGEALRAG